MIMDKLYVFASILSIILMVIALILRPTESVVIISIWDMGYSAYVIWDYFANSIKPYQIRNIYKRNMKYNNDVVDASTLLINQKFDEVL